MADRIDGREDAGRKWRTGWEDQERNALEASMAATPLQRLEWLEEALELAWKAGALDSRHQRAVSEKW